jgi:hypothetical protein
VHRSPSRAPASAIMPAVPTPVLQIIGRRDTPAATRRRTRRARAARLREAAAGSLAGRTPSRSSPNVTAETPTHIRRTCQRRNALPDAVQRGCCSRVVPSGASGPFERGLIARGDIERDGQRLGGDPVPDTNRFLPSRAAASRPHQGPLRTAETSCTSGFPARSAQFGTKRAEYMAILLRFDGLAWWAPVRFAVFETAGLPSEIHPRGTSGKLAETGKLACTGSVGTAADIRGPRGCASAPKEIRRVHVLQPASAARPRGGGFGTRPLRKVHFRMSEVRLVITAVAAERPVAA